MVITFRVYKKLCKRKYLWPGSVVAFIGLSCYEERNIRDNVEWQLHLYRRCYVGIRVVWSVFLVENPRQNKILHFRVLTSEQNCYTGDPNLKRKKQLRNC